MELALKRYYIASSSKMGTYIASERIHVLGQKWEEMNLPGVNRTEQMHSC